MSLFSAALPLGGYVRMLDERSGGRFARRFTLFVSLEKPLAADGDRCGRPVG